ncbi:MAG: hypothetical protein CMJ62_07975 [Planctomycetaceae bacterium]|nr:hypothetical protein [Planctomycetaceae bacterium]
MTVVRNTNEVVNYKRQGILRQTSPGDESLIVNRQTRGLANVIVFLYQKRDSDPPPIHPSYDESAITKLH